MWHISRRCFLAGALAAAAPFRATARAVSAPSFAARDFIESIGVNTHLSSEPYVSRFPIVSRLVADLGTRHFRDELRPSNDLSRWSELFDKHGVRSNLLVSPSTNTVADMNTYIGKLGREKISAIEGQNEGNSDWFMAQESAQGNWARTVIEYQREVFDAVRQRYGEALPVISPSVINWKPADMKLLRDAAPFCDYVAIHSYPQGAQEPETDADYAALSWYLKMLRDPFKPDAPVMSTEAGYNNIVKPGGSGVSEKASSIYLLRMLLNNYAHGVERTFLYQLLDSGDDPKEWEHHFGLVRHDDTPKPVFVAIANLIHALNVTKSESSARSPNVTLYNAVKSARLVPLTHDDGTLTAAVWRAERSWNVEKAIDIDVAPEPVIFNADQPLDRVQFVVPNEGRDWQDVTIQNGQFVISTADKIVLVRVTPRV